MTDTKPDISSIVYRCLVSKSCNLLFSSSELNNADISFFLNKANLKASLSLLAKCLQHNNPQPDNVQKIAYKCRAIFGMQIDGGTLRDLNNSGKIMLGLNHN